MTTPQRAQGQRCEAIAEAHLARHGLVPIARNFSCRFGELDLVMRERDTLVVVEVRARAPSAFGSAAESIGPRKRARVARAAAALLGARPEFAALRVRFDVVAIEVGGDAPRIEWLRAAFDAA